MAALKITLTVNFFLVVCTNRRNKLLKFLLLLGFSLMPISSGLTMALLNEESQYTGLLGRVLKHVDAEFYGPAYHSGVVVN